MSDKQASPIQSLIWQSIPLVAFVGALWLLFQESKSIHLTEVINSFRAIPASAVITAIGLTILNFIVLIGYDWLGVRMLHHPIRNSQIAMTSMLSYAFSNALGILFGGTPIRWRLYSAWGLSAAEIVRLIFYITVSFWIGLCVLAGVLFIASPFDIPSGLHVPIPSSRSLGLGLLAIATVFFLLCAFRKAPLAILGVDFQPPPLIIGLAQATVAALDLLLASATLYVLLPPELAIGFLSFTTVFLLAILVAVVSNVPGGLGVLELVLLAMLPNTSNSLVASLLAFRVIYYLFPLLIAMLAVSILATRHHHQKAKYVFLASAKVAGLIGPRFITAACYIAGVVLLVSGTLPSVEGRMEIIRRFLPLPAIEVSHFLGSIIGTVLIILARALQRRIDTAWWLALLLLSFGVLVSLMKGFDYEEAIILSLLIGILIPCRKQFYRRGRILGASSDIGWVFSMAMSLSLLVWLSFFAYRHIEYSNELWWEFAYESDAPRALRAIVGAAVVLSVVAVSRVLRVRRHVPPLATDTELKEVALIVQQSKATNANLALLGDKRFIFSTDRKAFVMFGCEGKSWVALGDPVGPEKSADDAAWQFREACDEAGVWPVFYQVSEESLGRYIEMGFSMLKLGEEAMVPIKTFSLEGSSRKDLRRTNKKSLELGLTFQVVPAHDRQAATGLSDEEFFKQLKLISDAWLGEKSAAEKGFSLGYFDIPYLQHYDIALVSYQAKPIAFANIWKGAERNELSIDLMRYMPDSPYGVMEYLFIQLMLWGHEQGFETFSLGMAPLSGVQSHRLGPLWNRVSSLVFQHGERFYNFQGLRNYKDKFDPVWSPKYLASPGGLATPQIMANVSTLIAGGLRKLLSR